MKECCKDNSSTVQGSQVRNTQGQLIEYKSICKSCGKVEKWVCSNLKSNEWVKGRV